MFNNKDKITLTTSKHAFYYRNKFEKILYKLYLKYKNKVPQKGSAALINSLLRGFNGCNVKVNINPQLIEELTSYVYIPAVRSYKEIIFLNKQKKLGKVKKIIVGPLGLIHPDSHKRIIEHGCIDYIVVASDWMKKYITSLNKNILQKVVVVPAGVDMEYFAPKIDNKNNKRILLYTKNTHLYEDTKIQEQNTIKLLNKLNLKYKKITYGEYKIEDYKNYLQNTNLSIFITQSETQGICFAESWSMNIPIIAYNKTSPVAIVGNGIKRKINYYKTCPYINKKNGLLFNNSQELKNLLLEYKNNKENFLVKFSPRDWLKSNMTDKMYAQKIISLFD